MIPLKSWSVSPLVVLLSQACSTYSSPDVICLDPFKTNGGGGIDALYLQAGAADG